MSRHRVRAVVFWTTVVLSLLLMLLPLPEAIVAFKPYWPALVLVYWALESTDLVRLGLAFGVGLSADVLYGAMLGEQALRLTIMIFIVLRFRARLRFFPMWQQALAVFALLLNDRIIELALRSFAGHPLLPAAYWMEPFVGALVWPFLFLLLDDVRARLRAYETWARRRTLRRAAGEREEPGDAAEAHPHQGRTEGVQSLPFARTGRVRPDLPGIAGTGGTVLLAAGRAA